MTTISKLVTAYQGMDHWEALEMIRDKFNRVSEIIDVIHASMNLNEVAKVRRELTPLLVECMLLQEITKNQLSIMPTEWNKEVDRQVEKYMNEAMVTMEPVNKKPNFDDMDF